MVSSVGIQKKNISVVMIITPYLFCFPCIINYTYVINEGPHIQETFDEPVD